MRDARRGTVLTPNRYLLWLNWPIGAFRLSPESRTLFKSLARGEVVAVADEASFLRELPTATHAVVWEFNKAWFARARRLRVLATPGAGRELLPSDGELPPGVVRVNGAFHGRIIAETVIAFVFAHARGLYTAYDWQLGVVSPRCPDAPRPANLLWPRGELSPFCTCVAGTKAVILGYGKIGRAIGDRLAALGVSIAGIGRANVGTLKAELRDADWLIMALPGDTGTDSLVDAAVLGVMKRTAVLVNVGRGNAVDESALASALRERRLAAAYLDVYAHEPLDASSPLAENLPGLVRFPHASAFAPEYLPLFFRELAEGGWLS